MYRHDQVAARAQIDCLHTQLGELSSRLLEAEAERQRAERELDRVREGIGDDPKLLDERGYRRTQLGLRTLALLSTAGVVAGLVPLFEHFFGEPYLSFQGVLNLAFQFSEGSAFTGLAAAGAVLMLASPWLVLPWLGAIGLRRVRRWGWVLAIVSALLYLPTPLMPIALYAMVVLCSGRVRALYFPR